MRQIKKHPLALPLVAVMVVTIIFTAYAVLYMHQIRSDLQQESFRTMREISRQGASAIRAKINDDLYTLGLVADAIVYLDATDTSTITALLDDATSSIPHFTALTLLYPDNTTLTSGGREGKYAAIPGFQELLVVENGVTDVVVDPQSDTLVNLYVVPVLENGLPVAVLTATVDNEIFSEMLSVSFYDNQGYSRIVNQYGNVVAESAHSRSLKWGHNLFSLDFTEEADALEMSRQFDQGGSGVTHYRNENGQARYLAYTPLDINGWYLLLIVPEEVVSQHTDAILRFVSIMLLLTAFVLGSLIAGILYTQRRKYEQVHHLAYQDPLTGLSNWHRFLLDSRQRLDHHPKQPYAFLVAEVDKFHMLKDMLGDELIQKKIQQLGEVIASACTREDLCARRIESQFTMLIAYHNEQMLSERINELIQAGRTCFVGLLASISIGVYKVEDNTMPVERMYDYALIAKNEITHAWDTFHYTFDDLLKKRLDTEKMIEPVMQNALSSGQFVVHYQPKVRATDGRIVGAEALVRWEHPDLGNLAPGVFLAVFERNGFITNLDMYVFRQVCGAIKRWEAMGIPMIPVSVNFSRLHLGNSETLAALKTVAAETAINPSHIEIELTEESFTEDMPMIRKFVDDIHSAGFLIAVDDFGKGYSSLSMLYGLPVDIVKLDRSFFQEITTSERACTIIRSIVSMTQSLSIETVSEGIETAEQVECLIALGCSVIQGFYFAKPMPEEDFLQMLGAQNAFAPPLTEAMPALLP